MVIFLAFREAAGFVSLVNVLSFPGSSFGTANWGLDDSDESALIAVVLDFQPRLLESVACWLEFDTCSLLFCDI